jgi:hypothetical protein
MQHDRRVHRLLERDGRIDVVVVPVGEGDGAHPTSGDGRDDRPGVVGGIDHDDLAIAADQPDVVRDVPLAAIEGEDARRGDELDHRTTTLRSTSPRSMR